MRRLAFLFLPLLLAAAPAAADPVTVPDSEVRVMHARDDGREYRILVARPAGPPPPAGFPVLYVLDGNAAFATVAEAVRVQGRRTAATGVAQAVVIGIGYPTDEPYDDTRRIRDFTTPADPARLPPRPDGSPWPANGGADAFMRFLVEEVKPAIAADIPVDRTRESLFGHSLGGLFVLHTLFTRPDAFRAYAAISPSLWWNDRAILEEERRFAAAPPTPGSRLLIAVGGLERQRNMVGEAEDLAARLSTLDGLQVVQRTFEGENHASVVPTALSHALRTTLGPAP